jgi:hypothetical protein
MLKLSIKGLRLIIVVVQVGAVKRRKERQDETQFTTKIGGKTCWGPSYCKIFIHSYAFDGLLCQNRPFSPLNCLTLLMITLLFGNSWK